MKVDYAEIKKENLQKNEKELTFEFEMVKRRRVKKQASTCTSSEARGGGCSLPHWPEKYAKYPAVYTFKADFCNKNENSPPPPMVLAMRIG